jgi:excinuclease UvrABC nuclease subunit
MTAIEIAGDLAQLDAAIDALPDRPAVFLLWAKEGEPYLSRTGVLRRRLRRLLAERERPSRWLNLRHTVARIEYRLTGSAFESSIVFYEQARRHFPDTYLRLMKLRMPPYVKLVLNNEFPRSHITTHLARTGGLYSASAARNQLAGGVPSGSACPTGLYFGPFRSRASAERFEAQFLDLFQMRRCQEDLVPSPAHPGCIYGEMAMCLRPCQQVVGAAEYASEIVRVAEFLRTGGHSLLESIEHSRDRLSQEMLFEEAARQHKRYERVQDVLRLRDELARDVDGLNGVAITPSLAHDAVEMWFVRDGSWCAPQRFGFEVHEGKPVSLDLQLRETFASVAPGKQTVRERQEYLALLSRWYYSTWREGEWLSFASYGEIPYRKLVNAVSRVARKNALVGPALPPAN